MLQNTKNTPERKGRSRKTFFFEDQIKFTFHPIHVPETYRYVDSPVNGIMGYLGSYSGIDGSYDKAVEQIERYASHINYAYQGKNRLLKLCTKIQKDFPAFRQWCKGNIERTKML